MPTHSEHPLDVDDVTALLQRWQKGDDRALDDLVPVVYADLRRLAAQWLRRDSSYQTLQPTALLNEVFLRLLGNEQPFIRDTEHLFKLSATAMRHILVDRARRQATEKHGAEWQRTGFERALEADRPEQSDHATLLALEQVLTKLEKRDERAARIIELRYFVGLSTAQVAQLLDVDERTVYRDWALARAWLRKRLDA